MLRNKKSQLLIGIAAALILGVVIFSIYAARQVREGGVKAFVGEEQIELIAAYQAVGDDLFYIDKAAEFALHKTLFDFANNGGLMRSSCITADGNLWSGGCFPKELEKNFEYYYALNFKPNAALYSYIDYDFVVFNGLEVIGISDEPLSFTIASPRTNKDIGRFEVRPDFHVKVDYDLEVYNKLGVLAAQLEECKTDTLRCVSTKMGDFMANNPIEVYLEDCNTPGSSLPADFSSKHILRFCAREIDKKFMTKNGFKAPEIKFAVDVLQTGTSVSSPAVPSAVPSQPSASATGIGPSVTSSTTLGGRTVYIVKL
ncbi:hypothetical protein KY330_00805 [Candidatus Woesearchaeota archaeon]|nr:hypothetical protein [Candidatus Woesearchaeota archaeon]